MATLIVADPWGATTRPLAEPGGTWRTLSGEDTPHAAHWRIYLGALQLDLFAPRNMPHVWFISAAPFADALMVGDRLGADRAKIVAQATLQHILHQHMMLMDGAL